MISVFVVLALSAAPELAVLSSRGDVGELRFQRAGASELTEPVVRFSHGDGSPVLGSVLPGTRTVVASASMRATGDLSFATALLRLEAGQPARVLAESLAYGSRPLVTAEGRVFVSRGRAGVETGGVMRVDALTVDEIDPRTAKVRTLYSTQGYATFLAGALGRELIIYEVAPDAARLFALHVDTFARREVLPSMAPFAHDFVVDAPRRRVLFTQGGEGWHVEEVSLVDGARHTLATGPEVTLLPAVRADGRVLISAGEGLGLSALDGKDGLPAQGPGFERIRFERAGYLVGLHERPGDFPSIFVLRGAQSLPVRAPPESRLDVAGVIP